MTDEKPNEVREMWDREAAAFDEEPDHGLRDPVIREAWTNKLVDWLPSAPSTILDAGCGTGSLSVILAVLGHEVMGVDVSPAMLAKAEAKATADGQTIRFMVMDAAHLTLPPRQFDVIVCRHLLWALPEPARVLRHWASLLKPGGRVVLIEGYWYTGAGLHSTEIMEALPPSLTCAAVENLSPQTDLWGREVTDERYVVRADLFAQASGTNGCQRL